MKTTYPLPVLLGSLALMLAACASPEAPPNAAAAQAAGSLPAAQTTTIKGLASSGRNAWLPSG